LCTSIHEHRGGDSGSNAHRTNMDANNRNLHTDVVHKIEGNIRSFLGIIEHHTIKSYEKMKAGLHAFQTGQYEHNGFILTPYTCCQRGWLNTESVRKL
jgi:hypothetical protein